MQHLPACVSAPSSVGSDRRCATDDVSGLPCADIPSVPGAINAGRLS